MGSRKLFLLSVLFILLSAPVAADIGSKPQMEFDIVYNISEDISLQGGQQLQCSSASCQNATVLEEFGPQGFRCSEDRCSSLAYGYTEFNRLRLNFSDGTRMSNVFTMAGEHATFRVIVQEDRLRVVEATPRGASPGSTMFLLTVLLTLLIELPLATVFLAVNGSSSRRMLGLVVLANIVSLTCFWVLFGPLSGLVPVAATIGLLELFAVGSEFLVLDRLGDDQMTRRRTAILSLLMNLASFMIGGPVLLLVTTF